MIKEAALSFLWLVVPYLSQMRERNVQLGPDTRPLSGCWNGNSRRQSSRGLPMHPPSSSSSSFGSLLWTARLAGQLSDIGFSVPTLPIRAGMYVRMLHIPIHIYMPMLAVPADVHVLTLPITADMYVPTLPVPADMYVTTLRIRVDMCADIAHT